MDFIYLIIGIVLLTLGGEALIRGSLAAAGRLGITPLLSGLIIVGFGTSAPELVVSIDAAINNRPEIALGNIVGSNTGNILLILGLCAVITPMAVKPLILRRDAITVVVTSLLFVFLAWDTSVTRIDATLLLLLLVAYLVWAYWTESRQATVPVTLHQAEAQELTALPRTALSICAAVIAGLLFLIVGARVLLSGAIGIAEGLGVSESVIGLTLVAAGTSLPELSISVFAAMRRHADVAVGNVLGSNIFNLLGVLGFSALLQPLPVHARMLQFDQWVMVGTALLLIVFLVTGRRISRFEGFILLTGYIAYVVIGFQVFG